MVYKIIEKRENFYEFNEYGKIFEKLCFLKYRVYLKVKGYDCIERVGNFSRRLNFFDRGERIFECNNLREFFWEKLVFNVI